VCMWCLCVRLSVCLSRGYLRSHTRDLYQFFCACCLWSWLGLLWQGDGSQGKGAVLGIFFPIDNALCSIAFRTHTKTAEPINMPFWMKIPMGPRNHVLYEGVDPPTGRGIGGCPGHSKALAIFDAAVAAASLPRSLQNGSFNRQ